MPPKPYTPSTNRPEQNLSGPSISRLPVPRLDLAVACMMAACVAVAALAALLDLCVIGPGRWLHPNGSVSLNENDPTTLAPDPIEAVKAGWRWEPLTTKEPK